MGYILRVKYFNSFWLKKVVGNAPAIVPVPFPPGQTPVTINAEYGIVDNLTPLPTWPGVPWNPAGYPTFPWGNALVNNSTDKAMGKERQWFVEESRIRGGYNNTSTDYGVRAYLASNQQQQHRSNSLIYSGLFNSRTGVNQTNVFSIGEDITKSLDPANGSIQKLHAEDTNLICFQENKVSRALIDKDALYSAEGGGTVTSSKAVIGEFVPYKGQYGIATFPESFGFYSYQKYFVDRNRGAVLRLSNDGFTEISEYGMRDFFRDYLPTVSESLNQSSLVGYLEGMTLWPFTNTFNLWLNNDCPCCNMNPGSLIEIKDSLGNWIVTGAYILSQNPVYGNEPCNILVSKLLNSADYGYGSWSELNDVPNSIKIITYDKPKIVGGYDIHQKAYVVSLQPSFSTQTCGFENPYQTLHFDEAINGWVSFYDYKPNFIASLKNDIYSTNDWNLWRHYSETVDRGDYYGQGIKPSSVTFIFNPNVGVVKNFMTIAYEGSNGWRVDFMESDFTEPNQNPPMAITNPPSTSGSWITYMDSINSIPSYEYGRYIDPNTGEVAYAGFNRKENRYVANVINNSSPNSGEVVWGEDMTGIKGFYTTVKVSTDSLTQPGGMKELYAVSSNYNVSSI
jgi:hypothetical protein